MSLFLIAGLVLLHYSGQFFLMIWKYVTRLRFTQNVVQRLIRALSKSLQLRKYESWYNIFYLVMSYNSFLLRIHYLRQCLNFICSSFRRKKPQTEMNEHPHLVTKNRKYNNSNLVAIETKSAICGISSLREDIFQAR